MLACKVANSHTVIFLLHKSEATMYRARIFNVRCGASVITLYSHEAIPGFLLTSSHAEAVNRTCDNLLESPERKLIATSSQVSSSKSICYGAEV